MVFVPSCLSTSHLAEREQRRRAAGCIRCGVRCRFSRWDELAFVLHSARVMKFNQSSMWRLVHVKIRRTSDMRQCRLSLAMPHLGQVVHPEYAKHPPWHPHCRKTTSWPPNLSDETCTVSTYSPLFLYNVYPQSVVMDIMPYDIHGSQDGISHTTL